ncbi:hypothetical protein BJP40_06775 [Streptomyces sp. CC53]|uniref:hypothetical protein n=1 Tax=Streptomyces sp. CC53 TaxID=1906740 RepID=UPI0008DD47A6|nr:hypothetical protein [Streptomyces sp. CC53]OII61225.1 hypothetical protein BJP40_06775 [Streptomyces sp. CC53]
MNNEVEVASRLARIEARLDELVRLNQSRGEDHEQRIRTLERWRYAIPPTVVAAVISALVAIFGK